VFIELLDDEMFTARALSTQWVDCRILRIGEHVTQEKINESRNLDIDNLPVSDDSGVLGYARVADLHRDQVVNASHLFRRYAESIIGPSERLLGLARRFLDDGVESYRLYFVSDGSSNPLGVMTYADLNRRSSYIYCYVMISFLEQWIKKEIVSKYQTAGRRLRDDWMSSLNSDRTAELLLWAKEKSQTTLGVANLSDLIQVLRRDLKPRTDRSFRRMLASAEALRPRIAHPVKLLVPRSDSNSLSHLIDFWREMMPIIQQNDLNEKNGGWPVHST
jgi:hypothetical protein